jgi:PST family polysaccharide transporter
MAVQLANYIAPFIILIHLTKTLGLEIYGVLAFAQGIIAISTVILDFGYNLSATNKISKHRGNKRYITNIISGVYVVKIFAFSFCAIAILIYSSLTEKYSDYKLLFLLSLAPIAIQGFLPVWLFHGIERMRFFAIATIVAKFIFAFTAIAFIRRPSDYYLVPVLNATGQFFALMASIYFIYKAGYKIRLPSLKIVVYSYKFTRQFFASRIAVASYMNGAIILLGLIAQPSAVAIYSMAEQLYKVMQSALAPAAAATYPYMAKQKDHNLMFKLIAGVVGVAIIGAFVGFFAAPSLVEMVFGPSWLASIPVLNIFFVAIVIHAAAIMTGYPLAALLNRLEVANNSVMTGAVVFFILLGLIYYLKLVTPVHIAGAMLISELCVLFHRSLILVPVAIKRTSTSSQ